MSKLHYPSLCSLHTVDYSKWERSKQTNGPKSTKPKTVHWSSALPHHKGPDGYTAHPSEKKNGQHEKSGRSAAYFTLSRRTIKNTKKDQESISKSDETQTLELLIRLQRQSVENLGKHCESLQEVNQQMIRDIEETDKHSFSGARESLILNQRLESSLSGLKQWGDWQIRQANSSLKEEVGEAENRLLGLQSQLKAVTADVADAQVKLHGLKTYKDVEYPAKGLQITKMKRELKKLKQAQHDEYEEVKRLCQAEMTRLETQLQQRLNEVMSTIAQQKLSQIPPAVKKMALQNRAMKTEIDIHKKMSCLAISTEHSDFLMKESDCAS